MEPSILCKPKSSQKNINLLQKIHSINNYSNLRLSPKCSSIYFNKVVFVCVVIFMKTVRSKQDSFSFLKFTGPVSGKLEEIVVSDAHQSGGNNVDYVAKPDYSFHYGVQDSKTGNSQGRQESRNGDSVTGEYRVLQDNGIVRIVRYTADPENGFQAHIEYAMLKEKFGNQQ